MNNFIGRQPIFSKNMSVFGYELLYRGSELENFFDADTDPDTATSRTVMDSFFGIGIEKLTGGKYAFVNFTEKLINDGVATLFPNNILVVELLENIRPTPEIMEACVRLRKAGYRIALDDFIISEEYFSLIKLSDYIKIDFLSTPIDAIKDFAKMVKHEKVRLLAEKIETKEQFQKACEMGFSYFQGYFFARPTIVVHKDINPSKLSCLQLLKCTMGEDFDFRRIANIIEKEVALYYKLLRLVNSSFFSPRSYIHNARQALAVLGMDEIRKWLRLVTIMNLKEDRPEELIQMSLIRARFLELLSRELHRGHESQDYYLLGLFSLIDVIVDLEMTEVVKRIGIGEKIADALVNKSGFFGSLVELAACFELGRWEDVKKFADEYQLDVNNLSRLYMNSIEWAAKIEYKGIVG